MKTQMNVAKYRESNSAPFMVRFGMSTGCNYNCSMCCWVHSPYRKNSVPLLNIANNKITEIIEYLQKNGTEIILLSWVWEPFFHKDIYEVLEKLSSNFLIYIQTNISLINVSKIEKINFKKLLSLSVNFNAVSPKSYKLIYWNQKIDNLKYIIKKILILKRIGVDIKLIFIVSEFNFYDINSLIFLARKIKVRVHLEFSNELWWSASKMNLSNNRKKMIISDFRKKIKKEKDIYNFVNVNEFLNQWDWHQTWIKSISKCNVWYMYMRIEENGDVYPCNNITSEYNMWNINNSYIGDIWNSKKYIKFRENIFQGKLLKNCCNVNENAHGGNYKIRKLIDEKESDDIPQQEKELYL